LHVPDQAWASVTPTYTPPSWCIHVFVPHEHKTLDLKNGFYSLRTGWLCVVFASAPKLPGQLVFILDCPCSWHYSLSSHLTWTPRITWSQPNHCSRCSAVLPLNGGRHVSLQFATQR
jgi:hypothetical protein